jgi:hypothetical protein
MTAPTWPSGYKPGNRASSAALCRERQWTVGTRIIGTDGADTQHATITAIGKDLVLADVDQVGEIPLDLRYRSWRPADEPGEAA